ncbi:MAG: hypothetical protein ACR2Q3_09215 [Woeseiaceae bacterium]
MESTSKINRKFERAIDYAVYFIVDRRVGTFERKSKDHYYDADN